MSENLASTGELAPVDNVPTNTPTTQPVQPSSTPSNDEYIHKSVMGEVVHQRTKEVAQKHYEKGRAEAVAEYEAKMRSQQSQQTHNSQGGYGGTQDLSEERIRQIIDERDTQRQQENVWRQNITQFVSKIESVKDKYPELTEQSLIDLGIKDYPEIIHLSNMVDNTGDVIEHLRQNPEKMLQISDAARRQNGSNIAIQLMQRLSNSIKQNEAALKEPSAREPLNPLRNSTTGVDSGEMTQDDWRNMYPG